MMLVLAFFAGCGGGGGGGSSGPESPEPPAPPAEPLPPPTVAAIHPVSGPVTGGVDVWITGASFAAPVTVRFGGVSAPQTDWSDSGTLRCIAPARPTGEGAVDVQVVTSNGTVLVRGGFTYILHGIYDLAWRKEGPLVHFSWRLSGGGNEIVVSRGGRRLVTLSGDAAGYSGGERHGYGLYRYRFELFAGGVPAHAVEAVVDFGRLVWDTPPEIVEGYEVVCARDAGQLATTSPVDVGYRLEVPLAELHARGVITRAGRWYFAVRSYYWPFRSDLSDVVSGDYTIELE